MTLNSPTPLLTLDRLGTIVVSGPDAKTFLQGQLSFDMDRLTPARAEIATCNSAQGRVQAVVWLIERSDSIVLVLPASLLDATVVRLRKYVLRAKVKIESGSSRFTVAAASDSAWDESAQTRADRLHLEVSGRSFVGWPGWNRTLSLVEPNAAVAMTESDALRWHRGDIEAGLPQVYPQTHESFVAQMLNVDLLGGIGFEKGCYTGQEIIARTHFRGAIKRRMFRFRCASSAPEPGTRVLVGEQHAGDVVDSVAALDGCELLAVVSLAHLDAPLRLSDGQSLERLALPYQV